MPTNLTAEQLAEWKRVCERATELELAGDTVVAKQIYATEFDIEFNTTARTAMPALIAEVERLREFVNLVRDTAERPHLIREATKILGKDAPI